MVVLVLNCGSSSVKFQMIAVSAGEAGSSGPERRTARGIVERIGEGARIAFEGAGRPARREALRVPDHESAVGEVLDWVAAGARGGAAPGFDAVGHRVVHGGDRFTQPAVIDEDVAAAIRALEDLAPLHNAPSLAGIDACRARLGARVPMVAVFDTAFHATLPERAYRYAIPHELALRHGIRRFGFHGSSYRAVLSAYGRLTGTPEDAATLVALHLGNGCSATAIRAGRSVDTSMGFTPLEGLVMGSRSGDLDPALIGYLARKEGVTASEVERWLNERSGLLGVSGSSRDTRELLRRQAEDPRARLALEIFCYRARKYVGAYLAALGGARAVVFSGGIGENSPEVREQICEGMQWCGLVIDRARNEAAVGVAARISREDAPLHAYAIPTDEELVIARDTARCLGRHHDSVTTGRV